MTELLRAVRAFLASIGLLVVAGCVAATVAQAHETAQERDRLRDEVRTLSRELASRPRVVSVDVAESAGVS